MYLSFFSIFKTINFIHIRSLHKIVMYKTKKKSETDTKFTKNLPSWFINARNCVAVGIRVESVGYCEQSSINVIWTSLSINIHRSFSIKKKVVISKTHHKLYVMNASLGTLINESRQQFFNFPSLNNGINVSQNKSFRFLNRWLRRFFFILDL